MLTDTDLAYLREVDARERAATKGPWELLYTATVSVGRVVVAWAINTENRAFIASARTDIPRLRAMIDRLAGEQEPAKCKYCSESSPYLAVIEAADPRVFVSVSGAYLQVFDEEYPGFVDNIPICYCPKCGRKLTDRKEPDDG